MGQRIDCIMLVDDDMLTNFVNKIVVEDAEVANHVVRHTSAEAALQYLLDSSGSAGGLPFPNLIFLDLGMPTVSGWEFINRYKLVKKKFPIQPVIVILTVKINLKDILDSSNAMEISDLYTKPLTPQIIHNIVNQYCALK